LDEKGAFLIKKAGEKICAYLGISKFTLYNYLEESKRQEDEA
jgi:predicted transcriptional regulator YheO